MKEKKTGDHLPAAFQERMEAILGNKAKAFFTSLAAPPPVSIRINPAKDTGEWSELEEVPWSVNGYYLPRRPSFTADPLFHAGCYYVQEASSMFLEEAIRQTVDLENRIAALDLCAAPGGKSTLILSLLNQQSFLLANEVIRGRSRILDENLVKWGTPNFLCTSADPARFEGLEGFFDLIVVDAPCSGEGLFRKDPKARGEWSEKNVAHCASRQNRILSEASHLLREKGVIIYSTCTYEPSENEEQALRLADTGDFASLPLEIQSDWGIEEVVSQSANSKVFGYRIYPHRARGEGFFLTVLQKITPSRKPGIQRRKKGKKKDLPSPDLTTEIRKKAADLLDHPDDFWIIMENNEVIAIPKSFWNERSLIGENLPLIRGGITIGKPTGKEIIPSHQLALSTAISPDLPAIELDYQQAILYLRKQDLIIDTSLRSWCLARYKGQNLGWMKILPDRVNNYYPKEWRIRMEIVGS